jgi:hypothetical protein
MIIQNTYPPSNINVGDILKTSSGSCYSYIGYYSPYTPPAGFVWANVEIFTATTATTYTSCLSCLIPDPTPPPTYKQWNGFVEFSLSCPVCELTNGGTSKTFYTTFETNSLRTGAYIYEDINLQIPIIASYMRYSGLVFSVDDDGRITYLCNQNSNC